MQQNYNKKRKLNKLKASLLLLMMVCFALPVKAQIWMKEGRTELVSGQTYDFYDSQGPSEASAAYDDGSGMRVNYWDKWYIAPEQYTHTFVAPASAPYVKVTFKKYTAYDWSNEGDYQANPPVSPYNCQSIGEWTLRLNDDVLKVYEGAAVVDDNLIGQYTGNSQTEFTIVAQGAMTFRFESNDLFREEGWSAKVTTMTDMEPQAPYMRRSTCADAIELESTTPGATIYYTTTGNFPDPDDPLNDVEEYDGTPITWGTGNLTVKAISVLNGERSDVTTRIFTDADRIANINTAQYTPGLIRVPGTNKVRITCPSVPAGLNETFVVYYTDGNTAVGEPTSSNYSMKLIFVNANIDLEPDGPKTLNVHRVRTYEFECTDPDAVFQAKIYGFTCQNLQSPVTEVLEFGDILVDDPVITFETTNQTTGAGTATITCAFQGATPDIYYTTDGSEPDPTNVGQNTPTQVYYGTFAVTAGMTVKAKAVVDQTGFTASNTVSAMYVPTNAQGEPQSGVYGQVVLLDDREPHSWSYYSDGDQPVHSLNPADVKISYYGNGKMYTSTTATPSGDLSNASGVQVSATESANQFVYLKTVERANYEGTGNLVYSLIPNPFSKRPTFTSGTTTYYTGFYGWRVKRLSGVTINGYDEGSIIPAETEIEFVTNNSEGNEVDFEAVWARAYVFTSIANLNANNATYVADANGEHRAYERNFVVLNGNNNIGNTANSRPATITCLNPDGTGNVVSRTGGMFTCEADTKYEYLTFGTTNGTITANNHYVCIGRGVGGTVGNLQGINGDVGNTGLNYTIRVESGTFSEFAFVRKGTNTTVGGRVQVKAILGCDFDRASQNKDNDGNIIGNSKLTMCPTNNNNSSMFFTQLVSFTSNLNKDEKVFDCVIKSGRFQQGFWDTDVNANGGTGENAFNYRHSIYCGANFSGNVTNHYPGIRYVTVEGGEMGNINGGRGTGEGGDNDHPEATNDHATTSVVSFNLRIKKDAVINGCVFGGAANTSAWGSKRIVMTGGQVLSWIAGGANGTNTTSGDSRTRGTSYIYVGGNAQVGGPKARMKNGTLGGQVFGAGRGNTNQAASMDNSNVVIADNAKIMKKSGDAAGNVYGGGNIGYIAQTANVYILGGTIEGSVFGGAYGNALDIPTSNVYVKDGTVNGHVYGGSNSSGMVNNSHVTVTGCDNVNNVFGGGYGTSTNIGANTTVSISGGAMNNVYGGGSLGTVTGNTQVTVSGGTVENVFGAGLGNTNSWPITAGNANIGGNTEVTITGGTVNQSVYGGGENGTVAFQTGGATHEDLSSTVTVSGGNVKGDVFGGGREGTTQARTIVNVNGGEISGNVYGGAYGIAERVYVAGTHTVNLMGHPGGGYPFIKGCVYGGSRLANDGQNLTLAHNSFNNSNETTLSSVINISGGRVKEHVYAAGFYGRCFGSCYINIGSRAVEVGPYNTNDKAFQKSNVYVQGTVWAGGDWGTFAGEFGKATITGNTNIYVDAEGYNTESTVYTDQDYMGIGSSILGCGTSCDAGKADRHLVIRNYGKMKTTGSTGVNPVSGTTRELYSAQLFTKVFLDNSHVTFKGQGKMNELNVTEKYGLYGILDEREDGEGDPILGGVYVVNGATLVLDAPASQLNSFHSSTCTNTLVADPSCSTLGRDALYAAHLNSSDNKVRVNNGSYIEVKYDVKDSNGNVTETLYGEVDGYAHMMTSVVTDEATCAYARPKNAVSSPVASGYDNSDDGGFLSYDDQYNMFKEDGTLVPTGNQYELVYENHAPTSKDDTEYFRVWRYGGGVHYVEGVMTVSQVGTAGETGTAEYRTVDVTLQLPAWRESGAYYRFDRVDAGVGTYYTEIDYGTDVISYNAACYGETPTEPDPNAQPPIIGNWMYYNGSNQTTGAGSADCPEIGQLSQNPDQNFGLVIMPGNAMTNASTSDPMHIISSASDSYIAGNMRYNCSEYKEMPTVTFRLTYRNNLSSNTTWDPVTIPLVQCLEDGTPKELVYITLTVNTETEIESTFTTQLYATMKGEGTSNRQRLQGSIVLPTFDTDEHPAEARFYVESAKFTRGVALTSSHNNNYYDTEVTGNSPAVVYKAHDQNMDVNSFGLTVVAVPTPDIMDDWRQVQPEFDCGPIANGGTATWTNEGYLGYAGGRNGLSIGFNLYYSDIPGVPNETLMGTLEIGIRFTHYAEGTNNIGHFKVIVQVYRRGEGDNFYVDGINGVDDTQEDRGKFPNYSAKTVEFVLSRLGFKPGDNIFIVNTVSVNKPLKWDGSKKQDDVNIWRYPGNHPLKSFVINDVPTVVPIEGNELNNAFTGVLFNVNQPLTMTSITVDGMYHEAKATEHKPKIYPTTPNPDVEGSVLFDGVADAPLFVVNDGGRVNLRNVTKLIYNCNGNAGTGENATYGGAVWVKKGGLLTMNETTDITGNINANGGGIYMDGGFVASSYAYVFNNFKAEATSKAGTQEQSNVWLTKGYEDDKYKCVQIGMEEDDAYNELLTSDNASAKIGIDKAYTNDAYKMDDYLPVVYTATSTVAYLDAPYNANRDNAGEGIIVHDKAKYKLEKYTPNNYLYWLSTWVTFQDHEPDNRLVDGVPEGGWEGIANIHTPQQLAWFISLVNGENNQTANDMTGVTVYISDDISMDGHVWVPVGTPTHPFKGTFEGNGHVITDMYGSLIQTNMGMFGYTEGATIRNAVVSTDFTGTNDNLGTVVGTMKGGTLSNVEGGGSILNKNTEANMGGLVGDNAGGTIHSAFAVSDMKGGAHMGGLVGKNTGNLYNAYSNVDFSKIEGQSSNMTVAGLVYENTGIVQNCYVIEGSHTNGTFYPFAATSNGNIDYCYAANGASNYVGTGTQPATHGTYDVVKGRKEIGYMYDDNKVTKVGTGDNAYITEEDKIYYDGAKILKWRGLLSTLNQWVEANPKGLTPAPTTWFRPITANINGDLPVLGFVKDNAMGSQMLKPEGSTTAVADKFLKYTAFSLTHTLDPEHPEIPDTFDNGIDGLLEEYNALDEGGNIFLYGNATEVAEVPGAKVNVSINEDAALVQSGTEDFTATVGVTFDNSSKQAKDLNGVTLEYDWHFLSSALQDAPINATFNSPTGFMNPANIATIDANSYFPNGLIGQSEVSWDFYSYSEPHHHWVNLKRNDHFYQESGLPFTYNNEAVFVPGKGYMVAISQDSYMSSKGKLNNGGEEVDVYCEEQLSPVYNQGWNLVGNPYQAYLDLEQMSAYGDFYIYDADLKVFAPVTKAQSENPKIPSLYIHPHQGFFMHTDASKTFTFDYAWATASQDGASYFRGGEERVNYPLVNLFAENERGNRDMAVVEFNRPELGGATKAEGLRNANFKLAASLEGQRYGILFTPEGTERVPLHFTTEESGTFTLTWSTHNGDFTSLLLVDNMTGAIIDMLGADHYTFDATTEDYASRFYITYRVTAVDENVEGDGTFAYFDGSQWIIDGQGYMDVVDVQGRTVYTARLTGEHNRVSLNGVAAGVYLMRVSDGKNTMVQKIVVK
jgi:hypothetical protein